MKFECLTSPHEEHALLVICCSISAGLLAGRRPSKAADGCRVLAVARAQEAWARAAADGRVHGVLRDPVR